MTVVNGPNLIAKGIVTASTGNGKTPLKQRSKVFWILIATSIALAFYLLNFCLLPPVEGDAYEFVGIARNLVKDGAWRADYLRGVGVTSQHLPVPLPPGRRGTLYVFFLVPFYAIFREHYLSIVAPFLVCFSILPLVTYWFGRKHFTQSVAFGAALAVALQPMFFSFAVSDPTDFLFLTVLILLATDRFLAGEYLRAGILTGLCLFTKENSVALYPAILIWSLLFKRRLFRTPRFYIMLIVSILIVLPVLWKRAQFYSNPITCDDGSYMAGADYNPTEKPVTKYLHAISLVTVKSPQKRPFTDLVSHQFSIIKGNLANFLFGADYEYDISPGVPETFSLILVPFCLAGIWIKRKSRKASFMSIFGVLYAALLILGVDYYENRYYFPILPFGYLFAFQGLFSLTSNRKKACVFIVSLVLAFDVLPPFFTRTIDSLQQFLGQGNPYPELVTLGKWVQGSTRKELFMTLPFVSSSFYLERPTTFLPYADIRGLAEWQEMYGHSYVFAYNFIPMGSRNIFPPLLQGKFFTVYSINKDALSRVESSYPEFKDVNPLEMLVPIPVENNRFCQLHRILLYHFTERWRGLAVYFIFLSLGSILFSVTSRKSLYKSLFIFCGISLVLVFVLFASFPRVQRLESMEDRIEKKLQLSREDLQHAITFEKDFVDNDLSEITGVLSHLEKCNKGPLGDGHKILLRIQIPTTTHEILNLKEAVHAAERTGDIQEKIMGIETWLQARGYRTFALHSSLIGLKATAQGN